MRFPRAAVIIYRMAKATRAFSLDVPVMTAVESLAEQEQGGNLSRMVGVLLSEALALRSRPVLAERLADRFGENSEASEDVDG